MVHTRSQQLGDNLNPENIIPLIQTNKNNGQNQTGGLVYDQHAGGTQVNCGVDHSRERTYTTTPINSNYPKQRNKLTEWKGIDTFTAWNRAFDGNAQRADCKQY